MLGVFLKYNNMKSSIMSTIQHIKLAIELTLEMYKTEEINDEDVIEMNKNIINEHQA